MDKNTYLIELSASGRTSFGRIDFRDQIEEQRVFSAIWELESQVNNGGFAQYFTSADGHTANFAPTALRHVGANRCADVVTRALHAVSSSPLPDEQLAREQIINTLDQESQGALKAIDQEFFAYPDNLTELLFEYVRSNSEVFGEVPAN